MASSESTRAPRKLPEPVETTKRVQAPRFAPEPIETTARSNRSDHRQDGSASRPGPPRNRPLPQPVESSARSSKKRDETRDPSDAATSDAMQPPRRHLRQPVESSTSSTKSPKFAPQLVETTSRRRSRGDTLPTVLDIDKVEHSPGDPIHLPRRLRPPRPSAHPVPPDNTPVASTIEVPQLHESRFSYANLTRRASLEKPDPRHSFRVPQLPSIPSQTEESELSDESNCSSQSATPPAGPGQIGQRNNAAKGRGGKTSGDLLSLAAQAAENQLWEQAMAAYPNERSHEPVDHFAVDRDDADSDGLGVGMLSRSATYPAPGSSGGTAAASRRESHAGWDAAEMRKHKGNLEREGQERKDRGQPAHLWQQKHPVAQPPKEQHHGHRPGHHHHDHQHHHHLDNHQHQRQQTRPKAPGALPSIAGVGCQQKDEQIKPMTKAASPPMAGQNLEFPKCQTPRQTRLDVGQYPGAPSFLHSNKSRDHSGLWTPGSGASRQNSKDGLWMGVCALSSQKPPRPPMIQTGLLTPGTEKDDPFNSIEQQPSSQQLQLPPSPPTSIGSNKPSCLDNVLSREKELEEEFHDGFVTQVYNYLSLGYPALARKYDHELSKITGVKVESLRQDDQKAVVKGYVGAPEGMGCPLRGVKGKCERWRALRLYVLEWGRQQPRFGDGERVGEEWGARARKGSWAI